MTCLKKVFVVIILSVAVCCIGGLFWSQELKYALPTPVPANFVNREVRESIDLHAISGYQTQRAAYLHFFNPDCPCSRFNLQHFNKLVKDFGQKVQVYAVIPAYGDMAYARELIDNTDIIIIQDSTDAIAQACGIYSTPQAVLIDAQQKLFYRGNYNKSRYCTTKDTNYAEIALTALVAGNQPPRFSSLATKSYGCELPKTNSVNLLETLFQ
jgi:hypothetical protein